MKQSRVLSLLIITSLALFGLSSSAAAAPLQERGFQERIEKAPLDQVYALSATLTVEQRDALLAASMEWTQEPGQPALLLAQIEQDLERILTPAQLRLIDSVMGATPDAGGVYLKILCWVNSKLSLLFSMVGLIGCPSQTAEEAFYKAWTASVYANTCLVEQAESCDAAAFAALDAYVGWSQLSGSCDVADTAMNTSLVTYVTCGGTW